jgi:GT2 family glycosyltransferase
MISTPKISAILTAWMRPQYLEEQVDAVLSQTVKPYEVILWYNQPSKVLGVWPRMHFLEFKNSQYVHQIMCNHNFGVVPRFALAACLESEYVCIFDDDTIPGGKWFENCLIHADKDRCILGTIGLRITSLQEKHVETEKPRMGWEARNEKIEYVDFVGHSWFFRREWAKYFWFEDPPLRTFGEDIHFCAVLQRQGIRSACPPHPESNKALWGSIFPSRGIDRVAISRSRDRSEEYYSVVCHEINKGFKPMLLSADSNGNCKI